MTEREVFFLVIAATSILYGVRQGIIRWRLEKENIHLITILESNKEHMKRLSEYLKLYGIYIGNPSGAKKIIGDFVSLSRRN